MTTAVGAYDVLVLGGGSAGCVIAGRLSEDPSCSVCLVEAGPDYGSRSAGRWPPELLDARDGPETHDWRDQNGVLSVARVIGGCSAHNLCFWIYPAAADWDEWARVTGDEGWSAAGMRGHIERRESTMPVRSFHGEEINPWLQTCIEAAAEVGLGALADVNDHTHTTGAGPMPLNVVGTTRWNAAFAYLEGARSRPNLTILPDCLVDRVVLDREHASGAIVRRDGSEHRLDAARVVVTAGSYGSPAILLRSGIGPEDQLKRLGISVHSRLPVGERLRDHLHVPMRWAPSDAMQARIDGHAAGGLTFYSQGIARASSSLEPDGLWDLHLLIGLTTAAQGGFPDRKGHVLGLGPALVKPAWTGTVTLRSSDPAALPVVTPQALSSEHDLRAILDGLRLCDELTRSRAAGGVLGHRLAPEPAVTGDALREYCVARVSPYFHPVGTCPMGRPGGGDSVVDGVGSVHEIENLYVADAAIMPTIPRANTNLPVLAAAEHIAARLAKL